MSQLGFWDWEKRHRYLEEKQDILVQLNKWIPWEEFREILNQTQVKEKKSKAGRKGIDPILMFKLLILQRAIVKSGVWKRIKQRPVVEMMGLFCESSIHPEIELLQ